MSVKVDLDSYDFIIVAFSGGKDSWAMLLHLLELGVDLDKVELLHHCVDGYEGGRLRMDWPITLAYCYAAAAHVGVPLLRTWKMGGFEGEMLRDNSKTQPIKFECPQPDGSIELRQSGGKGGKEATRLKFPQVSANLSVRWCSALM